MLDLAELSIPESDSEHPIPPSVVVATELRLAEDSGRTRAAELLLL